MTQIENGKNAWKETAAALNLLVRKRVWASIALHVVYTLAVLATSVLSWLKLDHGALGLILLILFCIALLVKQVYLRRWKEFLIVSEAKRRSIEILILGPDYICDIYNFTPRFLWFTLGTKPKNFYQSANFVSGQINWFLLNDGKLRNQSLFDGIFVLSVMFIILFVRIAIVLSGHELEYRALYGGIFQGLGSGLISIIGVYFMYFLDKHIVSLRMVSDAIHELDS